MEIILPQRPEVWVSFNYSHRFCSHRLRDLLSRQLLIIIFLRLAQAHLIPCKAHHIHSPRQQFLPRSQELKFLCYRRIRQQVHWRPYSHRHSQLLQLQLLVQDGIMRMTMTPLMCMFPHYLFSPLLSLTGSFEMLLAPSPVARTPSKHYCGESHVETLTSLSPELQSMGCRVFPTAIHHLFWPLITIYNLIFRTFSLWTMFCGSYWVAPHLLLICDLIFYLPTNRLRENVCICMLG